MARLRSTEPTTDGLPYVPPEHRWQGFGPPDLFDPAGPRWSVEQLAAVRERKHEREAWFVTHGLGDEHRRPTPEEYARRRRAIEQSEVIDRNGGPVARRPRRRP
ncbi:hypothetical protein ACL02T_32240 [Pseudonocardia sp. RS010]|uniref:hypothetical protein n=1 Tax=Pseudonocardia sp. RS010 TaxID=3385979 RepID=UPI0039A35154